MEETMRKCFWFTLSLALMPIGHARAQTYQEIRVDSFSPTITATCYNKNAEWMRGRTGPSLLKVAHLPRLADEYAFPCVPFATSGEAARLIQIQVQAIFPATDQIRRINLVTSVAPFDLTHDWPSIAQATSAGDKLTWEGTILRTTADWHLVSLQFIDMTTKTDVAIEPPLIRVEDSSANDPLVPAPCRNSSSWTFLLDAKNGRVITRVDNNGRRVAASFACKEY